MPAVRVVAVASDWIDEQDGLFGIALLSLTKAPLACAPFFALGPLLGGWPWWTVPALMGCVAGSGLACLPLFALSFWISDRL